MKKLSTKITAAILSFVFMFAGVFALTASAEEYVNFDWASPPYNEDVIYYLSDFYMEENYYYFRVKYIDTPKTMDSVFVKIGINDYPQALLDQFDVQSMNKCPNAVLLSSATRMYNCHSYAWYSQDIDTNTYWMDDPKAFYEDHSYCTVSTPQVGDIICYFDDMGTADSNDDQNIHSGIVTAVLSGTSNNICGTADLVTVTSKWGASGLYSHNGLDCPYTPNKGGSADYVKYYRSEHNNRLTFLNGTQHLSTCLSCNYVQCLPHQYTQFVNDAESGKHKSFCDCGFYFLEDHYECTYASKGSWSHSILCKCGVEVGEGFHNMIPSNKIGFDACRECGYLRSNTGSGIIIKGEEDKPVTE